MIPGHISFDVICVPLQIGQRHVVMSGRKETNFCNLSIRRVWKSPRRRAGSRIVRKAGMTKDIVSFVKADERVDGIVLCSMASLRAICVIRQYLQRPLIRGASFPVSVRILEMLMHGWHKDVENGDDCDCQFFK